MRTLRDVCSALVSLIKHLTTRSANLNCASSLPAAMLAGGHRSRSSRAHSVRVLRGQPASPGCACDAMARSCKGCAPVGEVQDLQHEDIKRLQQLAALRERRNSLIQQSAKQCRHQAAQRAYSGSACGLRQRKRLQRERGMLSGEGPEARLWCRQSTC